MLLYKSYLKYLKDSELPITEALKKMPVPIIVMLIVLSLATIGTIVTICIEEIRNYIFIALIIETVVACIVFLYGQHYEIENSNQDIEKHKKYCFKLFMWLKSTNVSVDRKSIIDIKNRIDNRILECEQRQQKTFDIIIRFVQTLIIPIVLAVFTVVLNKQLDINIIFTYGFIAIIIPPFVAITSFGVVSFVNLFRKNEIEKMKNFSRDLQGIIDTQLEEGIFAKNKKTLKIFKQLHKSSYAKDFVFVYILI